MAAVQHDRCINKKKKKKKKKSSPVPTRTSSTSVPENSHQVAVGLPGLDGNVVAMRVPRF